MHIPLMLQFNTASLLYLAGGAKIGFAASSTYAAESEYISLQGVKENAAPTSIKGNLELGFDMSLAVEIGLRWKMSPKGAFYIGAFLDYGLTDIKPKTTSPTLIKPNRENDADTYNRSILETDIVKSANLFSVGGKIKIAF
ncbi:hypothetical protein FACS1894121_1790 [Bacteroidia bacterium]|nr:hypothetical protein FACS1894121_1790 [Bacteroidia bacterium]